MTARQLFRNIWRANAIIILAAGVLALIVLIFFGFYVVKEALRKRDVTAVVNTDTGQRVQESLSLGNVTQIKGHPWLLIALESDQKDEQVYFSKSATAARNYGFVPVSGQTRWLYPHNRFFIVDVTLLPSVEYDEPDAAIALISFVVVQKDSDEDKRLTPEDTSVLMFTKPDGTGGTVVLEHVRRILSQEIFGEEILVVHESDSGYASSVFSLKDFSQVRHEKLALPTTGT